MTPDFVVEFTKLIGKPLAHWNKRDKAEYEAWKRAQALADGAPMRFRVPIDAFPPIRVVEGGRMV